MGGMEGALGPSGGLRASAGGHGGGSCLTSAEASRGMQPGLGVHARLWGYARGMHLGYNNLWPRAWPQLRPPGGLCRRRPACAGGLYWGGPACEAGAVQGKTCMQGGCCQGRACTRGGLRGCAGEGLHAGRGLYPLRAHVEGNAQVTLAQAHAQARAVVVAQAVAQAGEHTDRLYQAQPWAHARGQAECRRVMSDRISTDTG